MSTNEAIVIVIMGFYTLAIVFGIHSYEAKIKDLKESIEDYKRALSLAKNVNKSDDFQYESSFYKSGTYESKEYANLQELELEPEVMKAEPFVRKYGPKID